MVILGRVGAPHGVRGAVKIYSDTAPQDNILNYQPWLLGQQGSWHEVKWTARQRQPHIVVQFTDCNDRDVAATYVGSLIAVAKDQLPRLAKGEYYWHQLIGLRVVNQAHEELGLVETLLHTGAHDTLVVRALSEQGKKEHLIPVVPKHVLQIDVEAGTISVDWDTDF